jgi:hypothetical protein
MPQAFVRALARCTGGGLPGRPLPAAVRWLSNAGAGKGRRGGKKGTGSVERRPADGATAAGPGAGPAGQRSWFPFVLGGVLVYGMGTYSAMLFFGGKKECTCMDDVSEADRRRAYEVRLGRPLFALPFACAPFLCCLFFCARLLSASLSLYMRAPEVSSACA